MIDDQSNQLALSQWLEAHTNSWLVLEKKLNNLSSKQSLHDMFFVITKFRALGHDLALINSMSNQDLALVNYLKSLFLNGYREIYKKPLLLKKNIKCFFNFKILDSFKKVKNYFLCCCCVFLFITLISYKVVMAYPELAEIFVQETAIDNIQAGMLPHIANWIVVCIVAFFIGIFYGLGTFYIILAHAASLGGIIALMIQYHMINQLLSFLFAYHLIEMVVILLSSAAGCRLGEAWFTAKHQTSISTALLRAGQQGGCLVGFGILFLIGCEVLTTYIVPFVLFIIDRL